jgi:hypothetical protein
MTTDADLARDDLVVVHRAADVPAPGGVEGDAINAIRFLAIDAIQRAKSGPPLVLTMGPLLTVAANKLPGARGADARHLHRPSDGRA